MLVCLSVCLFVSNKRQNSWTDKAQILCGTSYFPREGLWIIKISKICLHQNSIFIKILKTLKIHEIFWWNPRTFFCLFYNVHKENLFTIKIEDGREALKKPILVKNTNEQKSSCSTSLTCKFLHNQGKINLGNLNFFFSQLLMSTHCILII